MSQPPPTHHHALFSLTSPTSSQSDSDPDSESLPLPFPAALSRADFLTPSFDPATYLSSLHTGGPASRHQSLEDLRSELRDRSAAISAELLELINANYTAFLGLGDELKGGEERTGDVRVGLLGFKRAVEEVQGRVRERRGRWGGEEDEEEEQEGDGEVEFVSSSSAKLDALAREYVLVDGLADSIGRDLPFVRKMEERMARCRNTILLDLSTALKEARKAGPKGEARVMKYLGVYRKLDAQADAVKILKEK